MKKLILGVLLAAVPVAALGAGSGVALDSADIDLSDKASLQRGAKYYFNYCAGCHSYPDKQRGLGHSGSLR